jgi:hypothetical protein
MPGAGAISSRRPPFFFQGSALLHGSERGGTNQEEMDIVIKSLCLLPAAGLVAVKRFGALKYVLLMSGMLNLTGCLSFTTTERPEHPATVSTVTRTETVYVTENGTRVRRVVTVDASGRRSYVEDGRTVYVDRYEY